MLDTNVVLDWLLFDDPAARWLSDLTPADAILLRNSLTSDELRRVLAYPRFNLPADRQANIFRRYESRSEEAAMPEGFARADLKLPDFFPLCRDQDDQPFLALAFHSGSNALVTKDKTIRKMRRRLRRFALDVITVEEARAMLVRSVR